MAIKLTWDYAFYWGVLVLLYYKGAVTDVPKIKTLGADLQRVINLNQNMQALLRQRASLRRVLPCQGLFIDQYKVPVLHEIISQLTDESLTLEAALPNSRKRLEQLLACFSDMLNDDAAHAISDEEREILGDYRQFVLA